MHKLKGLSLFSNVGVAETYFNQCGIDIVVANEIDYTRAKFYKHLYPACDVVCGDITSDEIFNNVINISQNKKVDFIIATPPCQGMSLVGKRDEYDPRNQLIYYAIKAIKSLFPKYVMIENVPQMLSTKIKLNGNILLIPDYLKAELAEYYNFADENVVYAQYFDVPQMRKRNIYLLSRKDQDYIWQMPINKEIITLKEAISDLPSIDPLLSEGLDETLKLFPDFNQKKENALKVSKWHYPPTHCKRQVLAMMHTPSGHTAFDNEKYYPIRKDGKKVNGHYNTYRRFDWDKPARTITQNNGVISSLCCVHPGRYVGKDDEGYDIYSDARVLTIYELLIVSSLPKDWNIPDWANERLIRQVIGEGIPPKLTSNIISILTKNI